MVIIWNKVTWYSKLLAVVVFAVAILLGFYFKSEFKKVEEMKPVLQVVTTDTSDWKTYESNTYGFQITYPKKFKVTESNDGGFFNEQLLFNLNVKNNSDYQKGTDLEFAQIGVTVSSSTKNCYSYSPGDNALSAIKTINGIVFHFDPKQPMSDAAMGGQRGFNSSFATIYNNQCYRVEKLIVYRDLHGFVDEPYAYPPHFDEEKVNSDFDEIINSFKFIK